MSVCERWILHGSEVMKEDTIVVCCGRCTMPLSCHVQVEMLLIIGGS